jgi:hypothetical protein
MTDANTDVFTVKITRPDGDAICEIVVDYKPSISAQLKIPDEPSASFYGDDLFECMKSIRTYLEARSILLLCNGARVDGYPSQMSRQMGQARRVYIHTMGRQTTREDLVDIFAEAPADKIGSVAAQKAYHDDWLRSLGWDI